MISLLKVNTIQFPTTYSEKFVLTTYKTNYKDQPFMKYVLVISSIKIPKVPLVRVHSSCLLSETFGSTHCDCAEQLDASLNLIANEGGMIFYLDQEARGHGIINKVKEIELQQNEGLDTVEASEKLGLISDERKFDVISDILNIMNINRIKLITNNPKKIKELAQKGIQIDEAVGLEMPPNKHNITYLSTKKHKLGHMLNKYLYNPHSK